MSQSLVKQHLELKFKTMAPLKDIAPPTMGWIKAIRTTLGMSLLQLGNKLQITKQSVMEIEQREKDGSITLKTLKEVARALDLQLVYGFVPIDGSLDALIDKKAKAVATKIVMRTSHTMQLEDQGNSSRRIEEAIKERTESIKKELPKILWD